MKNNKRIYLEISRKTGLSEESVAFALNKAISETVKKTLNPSYAAVDLIKREVIATYVAGENFDLLLAETIESEILPSDPFNIQYGFNMFSSGMIKRIGLVFQSLLSEMKWHENLKRWKSQKGNIVEGIINRVQNGCIDVALSGGQKAKMLKNCWVPKETAYYITGKSLYFYIHNVKPNPVCVFLSRSSLRLPALLLKHHMPLFQFACYKRYIGHRSFIKTNASKNTNLREACEQVSQELNGEIVTCHLTDQ